jgi:hypothetical protein
MKKLSVFLLGGLLLAGLSFSNSGTALAAGGGNSGAAHTCQHSGYVFLERSDGSGFSNTGACVSYAAHGGTLFDPVLTLKQTDVQGHYSVVGTGFHANSAITLIRAYKPTGDVFTLTAWSTDASGTFSTSILACYTVPPAPKNNFVTVTALDSFGVQRTASLAITCP